MKKDKFVPKIKEIFTYLKSKKKFKFKKNLLTDLLKVFLDKISSLYSSEGENLDKDIFINNDQKFIKISSYIIIITSTLGIAFLGLAKTDEIIVVKGKIIPIGKVKEIKMPMSGVIEKIEIKEGNFVSKNQILMRIESKSNTNISSTLDTSLNINKRQIEYLDNQIINSNNFYSQKKEILEKNIEIQKDITDKFKNLFIQGAISELEYLNQESKLKLLKSELIQFQMNWFSENQSKELKLQELQNSFNKLKGQISENKLDESNKIITSPVDGYVFDLKPLSKGYSAQMTEILLKIVPLGDLIAYLEIPSSDIGFVKKGMEVEISIDSYPATDFGTINGTIHTIGTDVLNPDPEEQRNQYIYPSKVKLKTQYLKINDDKKLDLKVGMTLRGNIKLRKVSYLQLLLSNFKDKTKSLQQL